LKKKVDLPPNRASSAWHDVTAKPVNPNTSSIWLTISRVWRDKTF
jgi:hypothetical protein